MAKDITVWTDGACFPNPGMGGWGWTTLKGEYDSGGADPTTNQKMELIAATEAIKALWKPKQKLIVISDSQYVIKGATLWSKSWVRNGWVNSRNNPVANREMWEELVELLKRMPVRFEWVKGHSGDPGNEEADRLATTASKASKALISECTKKWH